MTQPIPPKAGRFAGRRLETFGVSAARALEIHRSNIAAGAFTPEIDDTPIPTRLTAMESDSASVVHRPEGDGERVFVVVRPNMQRTSDRGFGHDVFAVSRGPYGMTAISRIGELDEDEMFVPAKPAEKE